ncbi:prolipoprotein diacylglyceryl transferase [Apibacter raozihei]|uniref:prolipoprotein diacylglyceryl transferase family protein n=1 Tax=Apibacter raozihei TaxID=2500547 RepID=UPI000FE3038D|nr:prolipoprotein diacylglyceryl transferase family protein [Apibacter raozihei]
MKQLFSKDSTIGKIVYGAMFCFVLPVILGFWAYRLDILIPGLPKVKTGIYLPVLFIVSGIWFMIKGMWHLWKDGKGLPMNAFPPSEFVRKGVYRWISHPIYLGSVLTLAGIFFLFGLASGVWIIIPCFIVGIFVLLFGYEIPDLQRRFGKEYKEAETVFPAFSNKKPTAGNRLAAYFFILIPWLLIYLYLSELLPVENLHDTYFSVEYTWKVQTWAVIPYLVTYLWVAIVPLVAKSQKSLRRFMFAGILGSMIGFSCFVLFPLGATPRPFIVRDVWGEWLQIQREMDTSACAFPSLHVFWACLSVIVWKEIISKWISWGIAMLISISCILTGVHSVLDVVSGFILMLVSLQYSQIYKMILLYCEKLANSWQEWKVGKVRIINHGVYVGLASGFGLLLMGLFLPQIPFWKLAVVSLAGLVGAGIWGQWLEASSQLMRPFGYYGGVFGGSVAMILVGFQDFWQLSAAFACVAPWVQAVGRLRCFVQGCCHGRVCNEKHGVHYRKPLNRVVRIAGLYNRPVYPTQLYSIIGNSFLIILLWTLAFHGLPASLIIGLYLFFSACFRFFEEAFRGEPQTPSYSHLSVYQWLAVGFAMAGIILSMFSSPEMNLHFVWRNDVLFTSLAYGVLVWMAMGVDVPDSQRPMSRLT